MSSFDTGNFLLLPVRPAPGEFSIEDRKSRIHFAEKMPEGHSLSRMMTKSPKANAVVSSRIRELQEALSAGVIAVEISSRNARVRALQKRWDRLRA